MGSDESSSGEDLTGPLRGTSLEKSVLSSLETLEQALRLEPLGDNRFRAGNEPNRFGRIFGGQLLAQAIHAASATVRTTFRTPCTHISFRRAIGVPVDIGVVQVRDGRSMATRQVSVSQSDRTLLTALASFHTNPAEPELTQRRPTSRHRGQPLFSTGFRVPPGMRTKAQTWIDVPPAVEMRIAEPTNFLGGRQTPGPRSHWMRLPRDIDHNPALHNAMLAYASDYLMLDMALRNHPDPPTSPRSPR